MGTAHHAGLAACPSVPVFHDARSVPGSDRHLLNDNALAKTVNGLYKAECTILRGPWRDAGEMEIATAAWVGFYNKDCLHGSLNHMRPAEFGARTGRASADLGLLIAD